MILRVLILGTILGTSPVMGASESDYVGAMATEHAEDSPVSSPASQAKPSAPVSRKEVQYAVVSGKPVSGYLSRPFDTAADSPGVIVIHEWWGLNDNIRAMADRLAGEGYTALAVDLYGGKKADKPEAARALVQWAFENESSVEDNLRQARAFLKKKTAGNIGVIGWCFGGGWSLRTAMLFPDSLDAAVIYYGHLVTEKEKLAPLQMPLLGIFGGRDKGIPVAEVKKFQSNLEALGKKASIHIYPDAGHAFANPSGERYDKKAAGDAWKKTLVFLEKNLKN